MMDEGPYPPGGISDGGDRNTAARTQQLAENVTNLKFSHTSISDSIQTDTITPGDGCIRMAVVFTDPNGISVTVKTATLLRNVWP
jgi:hypothetical protein